MSGPGAKGRDVAVIGGGLAGMAAALRAAELGLRPTVFEKSPQERYLCASRYTGGFFQIAMEDIMAPPQTILDNIARMTSGEADPALSHALAHNARRTLEWLKSNGVIYVSLGRAGGVRNVLTPPGMRQTGQRKPNGQPYWVGRSGDALLRLLERRLVERGGRLLRGHAVRDLVMRDGRCVGLVVEAGGTASEVSAAATVIADGGFQSDPELVARYISRKPEAVLQRNARSGVGDGLRMAQRAGARIVVSDRFYGHLLHADAMHDDRLWPYPMADILAVSGIVVNRHGRRFCDEGGGGVYIANQVAAQDDPSDAFVIFDNAIWEGPAKTWLLPPNPYLPAAGARIESAPTLPELAARLGIDAAALDATVRAYNAFLAGGDAPVPPRTTSPLSAMPIARGPFMGFRACAGLTYAMGGIAFDADGRVLAETGDPIEGLYAAGATTGGFEGGGFSGYIGGLCQASVFGMLAGEHIARTLEA